MDTLEKLKKFGVETEFEYDNDDNLSLQLSRNVFRHPLWRANWAYKFIEAEEAFEDTVSEERYVNSLCCTMCCGTECRKCSCLWLCCGGVERRPVTPGAKEVGKETWEVKETDFELGCWRLILLNPFFNLHYLIHVVINIPAFYVSLSLAQMNAVLFRVSRSVWIWLFEIIGMAQCGGIDWSGIVNFFFVLIANPIYLFITGIGGTVIYWADIVLHSLIYTPLIAAGIGLETMYRNRPQIEPLILNSTFRKWTEQVFGSWAWAANQLVDDPDGLEANGRLRDPIFSPKQLLSAFSVLPPLITQKNGAGVAVPFLIQSVVLWIVFENTIKPLIEDGDDDNSGETSAFIRRSAAVGSFIYYLIKAVDSTAKFTKICRGHTNNLFLGLDFIANVIFPYGIIPMAVYIVLTADGLDIVLNLVAIDFVTDIDEELFDESTKTRYNGPYVFLFRIKDVPKRSLGLFKTDARELVLVVDVWHTVELKERLAHKEGTRDAVDDESKYWIRDENLSQFQAKIHQGPRLERIRALQAQSQWNRHGIASARRASKAVISGKNEVKKEERKKRVLMDQKKTHLQVYDLPVGVKEKDIVKAVENVFGVYLGTYQGISYLEKASDFESNIQGCCKFKEKRGCASLWYSNAEAIPSLMAEFYSKEEDFYVEYELKGVEKKRKVKVRALIPALDVDSSEDIKELTEVFGSVLQENYLATYSEDVIRSHIKSIGEKGDNGLDSRVMIIYDFPFVEEGGGEGCKDWVKVYKTTANGATEIGTDQKATELDGDAKESEVKESEAKEKEPEAQAPDAKKPEAKEAEAIQEEKPTAGVDTV